MFHILGLTLLICILVGGFYLYQKVDQLHKEILGEQKSSEVVEETQSEEPVQP